MINLSQIWSRRPNHGSPHWLHTTRIILGCGAVVLALLAGGCLTTEQPKSPSSPVSEYNPPQRLSQTGLYDQRGQVDSRNQYFSPQYPLWTDGAAKSRWIYLPEGTQIDISNIDIWKFPVGTKLWKEFSFGGRKAETRMIWKAAEDNWVFASYLWDSAQSDAELAPSEGIPDAVNIANGKSHSIPGVNDCRSCHQSTPAVVLGFTALQLSDDRDPLAPHQDSARLDMVTLKKLLEENRLNPARPDLITKPPRIRAENPAARAAIGYLSANCGSCHNSTGPLARLGINMLHNVAASETDPEPAMTTLLNSRGRFAIPNIPPDSTRFIQAGKPNHSAVIYRMRSRRPSSQMPPLGTVLVDSVAVELIEAWIKNLE